MSVVLLDLAVDKPCPRWLILLNQVFRAIHHGSMKKPLALILLLAAIATFGFSLFMFQRAVGWKSPWFSLDVMCCFLGVVTIGRPLFRLEMPRWLRPVRTWELKSKLYPVLGVPVFGLLLRRTALRFLNPEVYLSQSPGDPDMVLARIESAEAAHLWAAVLLFPYIMYACAQNRWNVVFWFTLVQIVGNIFPILHLRWVRGRMKRCFGKKRQKLFAGDA